MDKPTKNTVAVKAVYDCLIGESIVLWGVTFENKGGDFIALLDKETAELMADAGRVQVV